MKGKKTEMKFFPIPQWKKEEMYLREQHRKGWRFVKVNGLCLYHFEKCEAEDVIYQLDYNPDAITQKSEYVQMFQDCGWEFLQYFLGYWFFRKAAREMDGRDEEIFCDDASRLDMMKRVFKGRVAPLIALFFLTIIPQIYQQYSFDTAFSRGLLVFFCVMFCIYLVMFVSFAVSFWEYYKSVRK